VTRQKGLVEKTGIEPVHPVCNAGALPFELHPQSELYGTRTRAYYRDKVALWPLS
jgi:hypothetical protein